MNGVFPRTVTERNIALYLHNNNFCLLWKSEGISFNQAIKEMKDNFIIVDNYITKENVDSHFEYEFISNEIDSYLTNFIVYDLESHNVGRARPYCFSIYRLSKLSGRYNRDLAQYEIEKCKIDTFVIDADDCITKALDSFLEFRGEERRVKNKIVEYNLQLHAHNASGFDTWINLNNLPCKKKFC